MRKLFTFLVAFLATLSGAVWGQETTIDLSTSTPSVSGGGASIDEVTKTITINRAGEYVITGSTFEYQVLIGSTSGTGTVNVTLSDATIELSKSFTYPIRIIERNTLNVILNIEGENVVSTTGGQAGITVPYGSSMTISGTGILNTSGHCGIGNANNAIAGGVCGNITISSGTVVVNGSAWCIGGVLSAPPGSEPKLDMTGDALLVVYDESTNRDKGIYNMNYWGLESHPDHGIYCNAKAQADFGSLYSDVTLQSPFPSDDFVVDLNGYTLTLGAGSYARKDQIRGSGTLNAYEVVCTVPQIPNATMSTAPASMYYGPSTDLVAGDATATPENEQTAYDFLGWVNNSGNFMVATDAVSPTGIQRVDVTAVFLLTKYALNIVKGTTLSESFDLVYPKNANVTVEDTNSELGKYGAKLDDTKKKVVTGDAVATADETSIPDEVTLTATYNTSGTKDIKLSMTVTDNAVDISTGTLELTGNNNTKVYDGQAVDPQTLTWKIINGSETITPGGGLEVKFKKDKNDVGYMTEKPTDVGTYFVYVVAMSGDTYTGATTNDVTYTITEKTLTVTAEDVEWKKSAFSTSPNFTNKLTLSGKIESDDVSVTYGDPTGSWNIPGTYTVTYINLALEGTDRDNYTLNNVNTVDGKLIVTIDDGKPEENTDIKPGGVDDLDGWTWNADKNRYERTYDGIAHPLTKISIQVQNGDNAEWKELSANDFKVTYEPNTDVKDAGAYKATVTINDAESYTNTTATINLYINPAELTINLNVPATIKEGTDVATWWNTDKVEYSGAQNNEKPKIEGTLTLSGEPNQAGTKLTATIENLELVDNSPFLGKNYTPNWKNGSASVTVEADGTAEIPGDIEVIPDGNGDGDGGDGQDPTKYYNIYDVTEYDFIDVSFSRNVVREGGSVNVYLGIPEGLDPAAVTLMFKRSLYGGWENLNTDDDGNYLINNIWTDIYVKAVVDESYIDPNPDENHIYIDLSETNDSIWLYTERKLVEEGKTAVIQAEVAKSCQNKEIRYMYKRTVLGEWKEMPKDYSINQYVVRDITTDIYVKAYFVFDKQDPTTAKNPHHVYADITATCEGLYLDATRHKVADEGDTKVFLYVKKGFETKDARYLFKRGLKGEWEDLVPGIEQNTFEVTNIEEDIYLKGIDAIYTGTEGVDGVIRVYTKDGSLYVYTAQPEEISVISMTGVTVKRTQQTGLQSYPLNQGIYVVLVGEQVFKVRVK